MRVFNPDVRIGSGSSSPAAAVTLLIIIKTAKPDGTSIAVTYRLAIRHQEKILWD